MKTKHLLLICLSCFIASLFSCQKDFTAPDNITARPDSAIVVGGDSNYLDRIYYISNLDTTYITKYYYDNLKRVIKMTSVNLSLNNNTDSVLYFYNSNDTIPFKSNGGYSYPSPTGLVSHYDNIYYTYQNNLRVKDSILEYFNTIPSFRKTIITYSYLQNKIFSITKSYQTNLPTDLGIISNIDTATIDINRNLISAIHYIPAIPSGYEIFNSTFTYDNKPNPFKRISNYHTLFIIPNVTETTVEEMQSKNNLLTANQTYSSGYNLNLNGKYIYNLNGFPRQITDSSFGIVEKTIFVYKAL